MMFASNPGEIGRWWRGRRVVVTGASGFIGRHLVARLSGAGAEVHAFVRSPNSPEAAWPDRVNQHGWTLGDAEASFRLLSLVQPEIVFHGAVHRGAGRDSVNPSGEHGRKMAFELTAEGGAQFAAACARTASVGRFVLLGSSSEYGPRDEPLHEDLADRPVSIHGRAKAALTACVRKLSKADLNAVVLRIFQAYGDGDDPRRFIPTICRAAEEGGSVRITERGFVRDYIHVDDVVRACLHAGALSLDSGDVVNVGTGIATDNHDVVDIVQSLCGGQPQVISTDFAPRDVDFGGWKAETTKMDRLLRLGALVPVQQGIRHMLQHGRVAS